MRSNNLISLYKLLNKKEFKIDNLIQIILQGYYAD